MQRKFSVININLTAISTDEVIADVPCGSCAKCCEMLAPYLTPEEITSGKYPISLTHPTIDDIMQNKDCGPIVTLFKRVDGGCGMLKNGVCSIYDDRPIACRQFDCRKGHHPTLVSFAKEKFATKRILIMGLPGAGKTYLAQYVLERLQNAGKRVGWLNADIVRKQFDDWDFSYEGRIRQSKRMRELADKMENVEFVICDFVAPLPEMRTNYHADWTVWVDTIKEGRFEDTNKLFVPPEHYDFRITVQDAPRQSELVAQTILDSTR